MVDEYIKNHETVIVNTNNEFIYEVLIFCRFKNYYSQVNAINYSSPKELVNVVKRFERNSYTIIQASLIAAPLSWIKENNYIKYIKLTKKQIVEQNKLKKNDIPKITVNKQGNGRTARKTNRPRT